MKHAVQFASRTLCCSLSISLSALIPPPSSFAQGPLSPTAPPAQTMKTLSQIEPRTPISALPATISVSGSYYVTTNLTGIAGGTNGVTILASDVTLDLCGFTLLGVAGSGNGITVPSSVENLAIHNGVLDSWGLYGVNAVNAYNSQFERLRVSNAVTGYGLATGSNCVMLVCTASGNNNGFGFVEGNNSVVNGCIANGNFAGIVINNNNCTVEDCTANGNQTEGISVSGNNCQITGNASSGNEYGIYITGSRNRIDGNTLGGNAQYGIYSVFANGGNSITRNFAPGNGTAAYFNYTPSNTDYAPTGTPNTATSPWANF